MRQGDPLSPLLFIMILEYLFSLTRVVVDNKKYEMVTLGGHKVEYHFAFTYDIMFFARTFTKTFNTLDAILNEFLAF